MIQYDGKEYRNLQEQVQKNKDDIAQIRRSSNIAELGIKIINAEAPLSSATQLPNPITYEGNYGDGYIVGSATPYELYIYSRSSDPDVKGFWFDWGELNAPSIVPGPQGEQGEQGETGQRGSIWIQWPGPPTPQNIGNATSGYNSQFGSIPQYGDQYLDVTSGEVYVYTRHSAPGVEGWVNRGNITGPQGIPGPQGEQGEQGIQGPTGPQGPQGEQGQFIQIVGVLENENQLPMIDTVPRSTAYIIPDSSGAQHVWLIIGDGTSGNPYLWHDAGVFGGGGTTVTIDGTEQNQVDLKNVINGAASYGIGQSTQVAADVTGVTFSNLTATGKNLAEQPVNVTGEIKLPIVSSGEIEVYVENNQVKMSVEKNTHAVIVIATSQSGTLTPEQLNKLLSDQEAYVLFSPSTDSTQFAKYTLTQQTTTLRYYSRLIIYDDPATAMYAQVMSVDINTGVWTSISIPIKTQYRVMIITTTGLTGFFYITAPNRSLPVELTYDGLVQYLQEMSAELIPVPLSGNYRGSPVIGITLNRDLIEVCESPDGGIDFITIYPADISTIQSTPL